MVIVDGQAWSDNEQCVIPGRYDETLVVERADDQDPDDIEHYVLNDD